MKYVRAEVNAVTNRIALIAAVLAAGTPAAAYQLRRDSSGSTVRWRTQAAWVLDRTLAARMHEPGVEAAVRKAFATVAAASKTVSLSVEVGDAKELGYETSAQAANQNELTGLEDWPYQDGALAVTLVTLNGATHEILDADIVFNLEQHTFQVVGSPNAKDTRDDAADDVQNTLTHELGHALGLMHNAADPTVVMFPGAVPGEIHKRVLASDDAAGLGVLYDQPAPDLASSPALPVGCSTAPSASGAATWALALVVLASLRRAKRSLTLVAAGTLTVASLASAEPKALELTGAERVAVGEVVEARASRLPRQQGIIVTDLTIRTHQCLAGPCEGEVVIRVPGGTLGDLEQEVIDHPVPKLGAPLVVFRLAGRNRLARLDSEEAWATLRSAAVKAGLPLVRSLAPRPVEPHPSPAR